MKKLSIYLAAYLLFVGISLRAQTNEVQGGIFNPSGNTLSVRAKPSVTFQDSLFSNVIVTIRWLTSYGVSLGTVSSPTYGITKQGSEGTSESYTYQKFGALPNIAINWTANAEIELFTVPVNQTGSGTGTFELTNAINNGEWYIEINGRNKTNPTFYQPSTDAPLPVQIVSFTATATLRDVELRWITATEVNNHGFDVERRTLSDLAAGSLSNSSSWKKIGYVEGAGTSNSPREYTFTDEKLTSGRYAYRLRQIDAGGNFEYFYAVEVEVGRTAKVLALEPNYPNPFNPSTVIEFTLPEDGQASLKVYNTIGQEMATLFNEKSSAGWLHRVTFDGSQFPSGVYLYRLEFEPDRSSGGAKQQIIRKMILVK